MLIAKTAFNQELSQKNNYIQIESGYLTGNIYMGDHAVYKLSIGREFAKRFFIKSEFVNHSNSKITAVDMIYYRLDMMELESLYDLNTLVMWQIFENNYFDLSFGLGGFLGRMHRVNYKSIWIQPVNDFYETTYYDDSIWRSGISAQIELKVHITDKYYALISGSGSEPITGWRSMYSLDLGLGIRFN